MMRVMLLGDSLVADHDWSLQSSLYQVYNFAISGEIASELLASLPIIKESLKYVDIIMVMVGTNDVLDDNYDFISILKEIAVQLNYNYLGAEVLITSLLPMELPQLKSNTISDLNNQIEVLAMQTGSCFLDIYGPLTNSNRRIFQEDGIHITAAAYRIWTRTLLEHIAFLIEDD